MKRFAGLALALVLVLAACAPKAEGPMESSIFAMDTQMSFTVYGTRDDLDAVIRTINDLDAKLSVTRPESLIYQLNETGSVEADGDLLALAEYAQTLGRWTDGALDVTLYPVVKAWGFTTGEHSVPDADTLAALLEKVNYSAIRVDRDAVALPEGVEVDFGALAKGYAGEQCAELLRERGVTSAILRLSGNIQTVGAKPDGSAWRVGIQDPDGGSEDLLGILEVTDKAVVTSGGYQRYFEENGVRYHHIIDPATGAPARSGLTSVTIVCQSGAWADGLSTALFVLGREKALDYWQTYGRFEAVLVEETGDVWITPGLRDAFELTNFDYTLRVWEG